MQGTSLARHSIGYLGHLENQVSNEYHALVVAAHPDDTEFGIAGTVALWTQQGKKVAYVICTNGNKGTSDPHMLPEKLTEIRKGEQVEAARTVGVADVIFLGHDDQSLEDTSGFRKELVREIRRYRPRLVAAPDPYRRYIWHRDHRIAGQVALDAVYPFARDRLAYSDLIKEGFEPHKVREMLFWGAEQPNHFVDVTAAYDIKLSALLCHRSQLGQFSKGWEKWFKDMHTWHSSKHDYKFAEAFYHVEVKY
jgi:LmbE family N-acetylglucosaminyl deacetylase